MKTVNGICSSCHVHGKNHESSIIFSVLSLSFLTACVKHGSDPLLSHLRVIPAKAGIQWLIAHIVFKDLLDTRFRGYDMNFFLEFHVLWLLRFIKPL